MPLALALKAIIARFAALFQLFTVELEATLLVLQESCRRNVGPYLFESWLRLLIMQVCRAPCNRTWREP